MDTNSSSSSTGQENEQLTTRELYSKISYEFLPGYRFDSDILYCSEEEQFYCHYSTSKKSLTYTCRVDGCRCRVFIQNGECYIANEMAHHHEKKTGEYYNLCALNEVKRILHTVGNQLSPKQVFDDVILR